MKTIAHTLYMDIVGSSLLPADAITGVYEELNRHVQETPQYRVSLRQKTLLCRPTGDGMALVFFESVIEPVQCAVEIAKLLADHPTIKLRIGIHSGEVERVKDINGSDDVTGEGVIMARRVMDCGDAGHILLSNTASDLLLKTPKWTSSVRFLGTCHVKHGQSVAVWNLYNGEAGNKKLPQSVVDDLSSSVHIPIQAEARQKKQKRMKLVVTSLAVVTFTPALIFLIYAIWAFVNFLRR